MKHGQTVLQQQVETVILNAPKISAELRDSSPEQIIRWALGTGGKPIITTNFGPYSAALIHMVTCVIPDIPVIWVDSGYNTRQTYLFADKLINRLDLNIHVYNPAQSAARRNAVMGIPDVDDPLHQEFTEQVKLAPFRQAMADFAPDIWFTGIRREQTEFRKSLDIVTQDRPNGIAKVAPVFYWTQDEITDYLRTHDLPNETRYFDPTKVLGHRECGLHTRLTA